jgi:precorrin-3B synthase
VRVLPGQTAVLLLGGGSHGAQLSLEEAPAVMVAAAEAFLAERAAQRSEAWRITELADGAVQVYKRLGLSPATAVEQTSADLSAGPHEQTDGRTALVVTVPLGSLTAEQAGALADVAELGNGELRVTPWRSVVLGGLESVQDLELAGLVAEPESPWNGVTACAGRPGCAKALADVRADARQVTPRIPAGRQAVHWSGCERRCGRPAGGFVDLVALGNGYALDGVGVAAGLAEAVAAARGAQ